MGQTLFALVSPEMRAAMDRAASPVALAPGAALFHQGDPADDFFILDGGEVEISVLSAGGRKLSLEIVTQGEIFGEIGVFAGSRTATATALGPVRLRRVPRARLLEALRAEPELALQFIEMLCLRLREVSEKLEERAFLPLPLRLAGRILHLEARVNGPDGVVPVSQADLADFVGATREAVAKTLAGWRAQGWIALSRGSVRVLDRAALEAYFASGED